MKLIIDIPDEKDYKDKLLWNDVSDMYEEDLTIILKAIANGIPLEDIRAEIDNADIESVNNADYHRGLQFALDIIDKYRESEDKE